MKKIILAFLCLLLAGCGTFNLKVQIQQPPTESSQQSTATPPAAETSSPLSPTATTADFTPTPSAAEPISLTLIQMSDALQGWGVEAGGRIIRTNDGGGMWKEVTPFQGVFDSHGFFAYNNQTAWAVPSRLDVRNVVWRTQDGGNTWKASQPILIGAGKYSPLSIQFPDVRHGWLLVLAESSDQDKHVQLYKSENSGEDWALVNSLNATAAGDLYLPATMTSMAFFDGQTGWLGGWWGKDDPTQWLIPNTSDAGANWGTEVLRLPAQKSTRCDGHSIADMAPGSMAVEVTCTMLKDPKYFFHRLFYLSASGEPEWRSWVITGNALSVYFPNIKQGWMLVTSDNPQLNQLLYSRDGGENWTKFSDVTWKQARFNFVNDKTGWAIVGNDYSTALVRTENGGRLWIQVRPALFRP